MSEPDADPHEIKVTLLCRMLVYLDPEVRLIASRTASIARSPPPPPRHFLLSVECGSDAQLLGSEVLPLGFRCVSEVKTPVFFGEGGRKQNCTAVNYPWALALSWI